jgi:hypothetical protein
MDAGMKLACKKIAKAIQKNPKQSSVSELAAKFDLDEITVVDILHNYSPNDKGEIEFTPGNGGGWMPEHVAESLRG